LLRLESGLCRSHATGGNTNEENHISTNDRATIDISAATSLRESIASFVQTVDSLSRIVPRIARFRSDSETHRSGSWSGFFNGRALSKNLFAEALTTEHQLLLVR
jgi:hypothetical protein